MRELTTLDDLAVVEMPVCVGITLDDWSIDKSVGCAQSTTDSAVPDSPFIPFPFPGMSIAFPR